MASNFIPMLSSSPPPMDDCPDNDDEDEEFGNFTSAGIQFDSSFDSPVAGEKFKPFKSGDNGVNDVSLKNELNSLHSFKNSPLPSGDTLVLSLSPQNQSNLKTSHTTVKDNEEELVLDESVALSERSSSLEKLNNLSVASQNCAPESRSSVDTCTEDIWVKQDAFNCSNAPDFSENEPDLVESKLSNCDLSEDPPFVPSFGEKLETEGDSDPTYIPTGDIGHSLSSVEPVVNNVDETESEVGDLVADSEHFVANFPVESESNFDEFDDFQTAATTLDSVGFAKGDSNNSWGENSVPFVANFEDPVLEESSKGDIESVKEGENTLVSDDEFDDFQGFDKSNVPCFESEVGNLPETSDGVETNREAPDLELEDFDDFQGCSGGFADFESESFERTAEAESSEFANFEKASFNIKSSETLASSSCLPPAAGVPQDKSTDKISTVIQAIFPPSEEPNDADLSSDIPTEVLEQSNKSRRLWEKLHEVEQTPGLRFQWGVSHSFQQLLRSVNVDYHSILRTSSVPIFASGLSLLEPVKGQTNSANPESEDRNQSPKDPIPPVEFDWNTSGLINPLDSGQSVSTLMDLSFLSTSDTGSSTVSKDHSFENEFLKPSPIPVCPDTNGNKGVTLEELLSKNVCSIPNSNITHRPTDLSEEANSVLDQLPDLTFMRAKVLMFPISSKT